MSDRNSPYNSNRITAKEFFVLLFGGLTIWVAIAGLATVMAIRS